MGVWKEEEATSSVFLHATPVRAKAGCVSQALAQGSLGRPDSFLFFGGTESVGWRWDALCLVRRA